MLHVHVLTFLATLIDMQKYIPQTKCLWHQQI